jgi:hypothetical protein
MNQKEVLLTFDYELFLGKKSGTVLNCLIKPTRLVLDILNNRHATGIFFIDALYLFRLGQESSALCKKNLELILKQIEEMRNEGHTIGIHIHPHWLDASYTENNDNWNGENQNRFSLYNLSDEDKGAVISDSVNILSPFLEPKQPILYRAGGFYCQPFSSFSRFFKENTILIDFSVMRNFKSVGFNNLFSFDFSNPPKKFIYKFEKDPILEDSKGGFIEASVNSFKITGITKLINSFYYRTHKRNTDYQRFGDGSGSGNVISHINDSSFYRYLRSDQTFSIELMNPVIARAYANYLNGNDFIHFVSHPKLFTPAGLKSFDRFLQIISTSNVLYDYKKILSNHITAGK